MRGRGAGAVIHVITYRVLFYMPLPPPAPPLLFVDQYFFSSGVRYTILFSWTCFTSCYRTLLLLSVMFSRFFSPLLDLLLCRLRKLADTRGSLLSSAYLCICLSLTLECVRLRKHATRVFLGTVLSYQRDFLFPPPLICWVFLTVPFR